MGTTKVRGDVVVTGDVEIAGRVKVDDSGKCVAEKLAALEARIAALEAIRV